MRRTVTSFLKYADVQPKQYILVEDSGDESVREVLAPFNLHFEILVNKPSLAGRGASIERLHAAIDRAYARVKFPYIFHFEYDWEFFRTGFIQESFILLNALPKASASLRFEFDGLPCPFPNTDKKRKFHRFGAFFS